MKLTPIAAHQLRDLEVQRNIQQAIASKAFITDLKNSNQLHRMLDNNLLMLKHKIIPEAVAAGKSEIDFDPAFSSFLAPWIVSEPKFMTWSIEAFGQILTKTFEGYTVLRMSDTGKYKISWANNG